MAKNQKLMVQALNGVKTDKVPVWLMRQAGRYLPEYRELRAKAGSFMNLCFSPENAAEVTLQPLRRFKLDAAILFSDILVIPYALGQDLNFVEGEGPRLGPLNIDALDALNIDKKLSPIYETVRRVAAELSPDKTLIGFAGAPWTVACYMIDGRGGTGFEKTKKFAAENPPAFAHLLDILTTATAEYLVAQIRAGADAVQIFDSWAGLCPDDHFDDYIITPTRYIVDAVQAACEDVPIIGFPRHAGKNAARYAAETGVNAIGIDQDNIFDAIPRDVCVQGNLAPEILLAGGADMQRETARILDETKNRSFVFNLGHGVIKETPPEHVAALVDQVKAYSR